MKTKARMILILCLAAALVCTAASADTEYVAMKCEGLDLMYKELGFDRMTGTDTDRARTAIMAAYDLLAYNSNVSILDNYIFVGLDKEAPDKILYIAFGGKDSSHMILFMPTNNGVHAYLVPIQLNAAWVETFMSPFCGKTYWQISPTLIKSLLK